MTRRCRFCGTIQGGLIGPEPPEPWPEHERCPQCVGKTEPIDEDPLANLRELCKDAEWQEDPAAWLASIRGDGPCKFRGEHVSIFAGPGGEWLVQHAIDFYEWEVSSSAAGNGWFVRFRSNSRDAAEKYAEELAKASTKPTKPNPEAE